MLLQQVQCSLLCASELKKRPPCARLARQWKTCAREFELGQSECKSSLVSVLKYLQVVANWSPQVRASFQGFILDNSQYVCVYTVILSQWGMIVRVSVILRRTVCGDIDWHFDNLSRAGHHRVMTYLLRLSKHQSSSPQQSFSGLHSPVRSYLTDLWTDVAPVFKPFTLLF